MPHLLSSPLVLLRHHEHKLDGRYSLHSSTCCITLLKQVRTPPRLVDADSAMQPARLDYHHQWQSISLLRAFTERKNISKTNSILTAALQIRYRTPRAYSNMKALTRAAVATTLLLSGARAQQTYTINPQSVSNTTRGTSSSFLLLLPHSIHPINTNPL